MSNKKNRNILRAFFVIMFSGILFFVSTAALQAAIFTVNTTKDTVDANPGDGVAADSEGNCSLRAAIMEANALAGADTINVPEGSFKLTITGVREDNCATGDLDIRSSLTIQGQGENATFIDGKKIDRVLHIIGTYDVVLSSLCITNGKSPKGRNIKFESIISSQDQVSHISMVELEREHMDDFSSLKLRHIDRVKDIRFPLEQESDGEPGGGILNERATLSITSCNISGNQTGIGGNTDYISSNGGKGGGIYNKKGTITINDSFISANETGSNGDPAGFGGDGGGLYNQEGTVSLTSCTVNSNYTGSGHSCCMGLYGNGGSGGGIFNSEGTLKLDYCTIKSNDCGGGWSTSSFSCGGSGGGIDNFGKMTINHSTIKENQAGSGGSLGGGVGGGIVTGGTVFSTISNCLISGNSAGYGEEYDTGNGGGILNYGKLTMINCTVTGNQTNTPDDEYTILGSGGGIYNDGLLIIESCTIAGNKAFDGGGGIYSYPWGGYYIENPAIKIQNTIIANNTISSIFPSRAGDTFGNIISNGYNLIETLDDYTTITGKQTTNIYYADPKLDLIADNGGPTWTMGLKTGSVCIDAGDPDDYETTDQRGVLRPKDGDGDGTALPDMGAFEVFNPIFTITSPQNGTTLCGTVDIKVDTDLLTVDFFIDGNLVYSDNTSPYAFSWDSSTVANGKHQIKVQGSEIPGLYAASQQVEVTVNNTVISLDVTLYKESSWIIKRYFGKVAFTVSEINCSQPAKYTIERKEDDGSFSVVKEVNAAELQGGSYSYNDPLPGKNKTYYYRVKALNSSGQTIGMSAEKTLTCI